MDADSGRILYALSPEPYSAPSADSGIRQILNFAVDAALILAYPQKDRIEGGEPDDMATCM